MNARFASLQKMVGGLALVIALTLASSAPAKILSAGDPAPALSVDSWVKGVPVKTFEKGHIYVVEFWATWCRPCLSTIPHLSALQKKYPTEVTIIGVAASEAGSDEKTKLEKVASYVKEKQSDFSYSIAFDGDGSMDREWMEAADVPGIPWAFIVDGKGDITWIGFAKQVDAPLAEAVAKATSGK